ncbi:cytochrome P450 3A17 [Cordyceps militaris]|uniref:Cytochrome P450 3A17 n=1 Tax=Cordyceps militaris TaxID=73501 RepID=A0A2H4SN29_CORMI|nr:cytochrome P450 3A17 [Cordyceps militaris]
MPFLRQIFNPNTVTMQQYLNVANNDGSFNENVPDASRLSENSSASPQDISDIIALLPPCHTAMLDDALSTLPTHEDLTALSISTPSPIPALTDEGYEILAVKAASIVTGLQELHYQLEADGATYTATHDINQVAQVFCAEKMRFFVAAFFRLTHIHFPLVHCASFGTPETSTFLILAVTIFGSSRCAAFKHTIHAQRFTKLADEYIYREVERLNQGYINHLTLAQLQTLQAAVAMTNFMMNHNDWSLRERARLKRLPTLIRSFIFNETAVRVASMTAAIDWNQARVFYCPPALTIGEMKCSLPSHRELWDAPKATAYIVAKEMVDLARLASTQRLGTSIAEFVSALMANSFFMDAEICHGNVTLESLSAPITAITALTISACQMNMLAGAQLSIVRAIARWMALWDHITQDMDPQLLLKAGLTRHCHENCTLALHLIETWQADPGHIYFQSVGHQSLVPIYSLVMLHDQGKLESCY